MNECVFCRIASGKDRSEIIYEDDQVIGLMDIRPIRPGHVQIIPREHFAYFEDLPDAPPVASSIWGSVLHAP
jgi:histidine triad (HIT) family protein